MPSALGARPDALSPCNCLPSHTIENESEPNPLLVGSRTVMHAAVAIAASTALPPSRRICKPACAASGCEVATMFAANTGSRWEGYGSCQVKGEDMGKKCNNGDAYLHKNLQQSRQVPAIGRWYNLRGADHDVDYHHRSGANACRRRRYRAYCSDARDARYGDRCFSKWQHCRADCGSISCP